MKSIAKKIKAELGKFYKKTFKGPMRRLISDVNKNGNKHKCNICNQTFNHFIKYHGGTRNIPDFRRKLNLIDSDRDNFGCPHCGSFDRERHLFLFFDRIGFWKRLSNYEILHFAPENHLSQKISSFNPRKYIQADYNPFKTSIKRIDATDISLGNDIFDLVICNHVLEHIPEYLKAISEIHRVLKPNGIAILQTPFSKLLSANFEDVNINNEELREFFYGEKDHFRIFGEDQFLSDLRKVGFQLELISHSDYFNENESFYYGVNSKEDLILVRKKMEISRKYS